MIDKKNKVGKPVAGAGSENVSATPEVEEAVMAIRIVKAAKDNPKIAKVFAHAAGGQVGDEGRNDCGYDRRFQYEDTSRIFGHGIEGEGMCDYPDHCPVHQQDECPIEMKKVDKEIEELEKEANGLDRRYEEAIYDGILLKIEKLRKRASVRKVNGHVFRGPYCGDNPCVVCGTWEDEAEIVNCKEDE